MASQAPPGLEQIQEGVNWIAQLSRLAPALAALVIFIVLIALYCRHQLWIVQVLIPAVLELAEKMRRR